MYHIILNPFLKELVVLLIESSGNNSVIEILCKLPPFFFIFIHNPPSKCVLILNLLF